MIPQTQMESWEKTKENIGERQRKVLDIFLGEAGRDFTPWELSIKLGWMIHVVRPRLTELHRLGILEIRGRRYHQATDRNERAYGLLSYKDKGGTQ